jgi:excisionase family DNA binding protein
MKPRSRRKPVGKIVPAPIEVPTLAIPNFEPILTPEQVAKLLQVKRSTVYEFTRRRSKGREPMPCLRAGKYLRFRFSEIEKWLSVSSDVITQCITACILLAIGKSEPI